MPEPDPRPINLSLLSQLALAFVPSAPPARAGSCMGANRPKANANSGPMAVSLLLGEQRG